MFVIEPTFEVVRQGRWVVMRVSGEIDMATAPKLRQQVQNVTASRPDGLVLDLDGVDFIDSTGLGVLRIVCSQTHLNELFELTRLDAVFDLYETIDEAMVGVTGAEPS